MAAETAIVNHGAALTALDTRISNAEGDIAALKTGWSTLQSKLVAAYGPLMPTFQGLVSEENLLQLIAYVKTLKPAEPAPAEVKK